MHAIPVYTAQLMRADQDRVTWRKGAMADRDCAVPCLGLAILGGTVLWASLGIGLSFML